MEKDGTNHGKTVALETQTPMTYKPGSSHRILSACSVLTCKMKLRLYFPGVCKIPHVQYLARDPDILPGVDPDVKSTLRSNPSGKMLQKATAGTPYKSGDPPHSEDISDLRMASPQPVGLRKYPRKPVVLGFPCWPRKTSLLSPNVTSSHDK